MSITKFLTCLVLIPLMATRLVPVAESTLTCEEVTTRVFACLSYLRGAGSLTQNCCKNIKYLADTAKTTLDRRTICGCLKSAYTHVGVINFSRANSLSYRCHVKIPYNIVPSINCSRVNRI